MLINAVYKAYDAYPATCAESTGNGASLNNDIYVYLHMCIYIYIYA